MRLQKLALIKLTDTLNAHIQERAKKIKKQPPQFDKSSIKFHDVQMNSIFIALQDLAKFRKHSFVKVVAEILVKGLKPTETVAIIDKSRKIFYIKMSHCWSSRIEYNMSQFDIFIENFMVYLLKVVYESELSVIESNQINNCILRGKMDDDVVKKIRNKFILLY